MKIAVRIVAGLIFVLAMFGLNLFLRTVPTLYLYGFVSGFMFLLILMWLGSDDKRLF